MTSSIRNPVQLAEQTFMEPMMQACTLVTVAGCQHVLFDFCF